MDEWKLPAHKPDNHWLDCVVRCAAAAASMLGVEHIGAPMKPAAERKRLKLSDLQHQRAYSEQPARLRQRKDTD